VNAAIAAQERFCTECGAASARDAAYCWLCGAKLGATPNVIDAELVRHVPRYAAVESLFAAGVVLSALVLVILAIGIAMDEPAGLIPFFIVVGPALLATAIHLARRRARAQDVTWMHGFITFWISGAAVIGAIVLLAVGALVALFLYCLVVVAAHGGF
jgi:hypothetical protein